MKKFILIVTVIALFSAVLLAENIAVLGFEKTDKASVYVAKQLSDKDFKVLLKDNVNYQLIDLKTTKAAVKETGFDNVTYLGQADRIGIGEKTDADILIWGEVSSVSNTEFSVIANIMSMKSGEVINSRFNVVKNKKERYDILNVELIQKIHEFTSGEIDKLLAIASQHFQSENYVAAESTFNDIVAIEPSHLEANFYLGLLAFLNDDYDTSEEFYLKALETDPENTEVKDYLSKAYLKQDKLVEAIDILTEVAEHTSDTEVWLRIGRIYNDNEYYDEAVEAFDMALELDPEFAEAYYLKAYMLYDIEEYEEAIPAFEAASDAYPEDDDLQKKLATCYKKTGKLDAAIEQYKGIIEEQPENIRAYMNLANAYNATEQYEDALSVALELSSKVEDNANVYILLATSYSSLSQFNNAEKFANKALEVDPEQFQPYRILSDVYFAKGYEKYERFIALEEEAKTAYGDKADQLTEERDKVKDDANNYFLQSDKYLDEDKKRTDNSSEVKYIKARKETLQQLMEVTKKDFF